MKAFKWFAIVLLGSTALLALAKPYHHEGRGGDDFREQLQALNLDAAQQASVDEILNKAKTDGKALRKSQRDLFKRMHTLDMASVTEAEINELSEAVGRNAAEKFRHRLQTRAAIAAVLTPEQREQLQQAKQARKAELRERMKHHRDAN